MNPFMFTNQKTTEELMRDDKSKFRPWFIWFAVVLTISFLIAIAGLVVVLVFRSNYYNEYKQAFQTENPNADLMTIDSQVKNSLTFLLVGAVVPVVLFGAMLSWFTTNFSKSLQKKDYSVFNPGFFAFCLVLVIFYILTNWNLPSRISKLKGDDYYSIISIFNIVFYVLSYIFIGSKCNKITKMFRMAKLFEQSKQLQDELMKNSNTIPKNMFGDFENAPYNEETTTELQKDKSQEPVINMDEEELNIYKENPEVITSIYYKKLKNIDRNKLNDIANKLNLFGIEELTDTQLRVKIANIYLSKDTKEKKENND